MAGQDQRCPTSVPAGRVQDAPLGQAPHPESSLMLAWAAHLLPQLEGHRQPRCWPLLQKVLTSRWLREGSQFWPQVWQPLNICPCSAWYRDSTGPCTDGPLAHDKHSTHAAAEAAALSLCSPSLEDSGAQAKPCRGHGLSLYVLQLCLMNALHVLWCPPRVTPVVLSATRSFPLPTCHLSALQSKRSGTPAALGRAEAALSAAQGLPQLPRGQ